MILIASDPQIRMFLLLLLQKARSNVLNVNEALQMDVESWGWFSRHDNLRMVRGELDANALVISSCSHIT